LLQKVITVFSASKDATRDKKHLTFATHFFQILALTSFGVKDAA